MPLVLEVSVYHLFVTQIETCNIKVRVDDLKQLSLMLRRTFRGEKKRTNKLGTNGSKPDCICHSGCLLSCPTYTVVLR